jgi:hypothetical protein
MIHSYIHVLRFEAVEVLVTHVADLVVAHVAVLAAALAAAVAGVFVAGGLKQYPRVAAVVEKTPVVPDPVTLAEAVWRVQIAVGVEDWDSPACE